MLQTAVLQPQVQSSGARQGLLYGHHDVSEGNKDAYVDMQQQACTEFTSAESI